MTICFYVPYLIRWNTLKGIFTKINLPNFTEYSFIFILWGIFVVIAFKGKKRYRTDRSLTITKELLQVGTSIFYTTVIVGSVIFFTKYKFFSRFVFLGNCVLLFTFLGGWRIIKRLILRKLIAKGFHSINILIIGANRVGKIILEEIKKRPYLGFKIVGFLDKDKENFVDDTPVLGKLSDFVAVAKTQFVDEVIITIPSEKKITSQLIKQAQKMRLGVRVAPEHLEEFLPILGVSRIGIIPLLTYKEKRPHPSEAIYKRLFDFAASLMLLILLSPLFIVMAILIKIDSSGPIFFAQKRFGLKAKVFNLYKFRTMVNNASEQQAQLLEKNEVKGGVIFKIRDDPRITKIGKFLRKYSLDELPQLWNVLKNDMSIIGPRPLPIDQIENNDLKQLRRLEIKPGITGLPQIKGRSDLSFSRWVRWDLWYINHWSFGLDIRILLWTIPAIIKGKGAY